MKKKKRLVIALIVTVLLVLGSISVTAENRVDMHAILPGNITVINDSKSNEEVFANKNQKCGKRNIAIVLRRVLIEKYPDDVVVRMVEDEHNIEIFSEEAEGE